MVPSGEAPAEGFPVLYILGANAAFPSFAQTMAVLSIWRNGTGVEPMLIVGIGYLTDGTFDARRRAFDHTPASRPRRSAAVPRRPAVLPMGGADRFLTSSRIR
jgi:predicted alpha/beta superfamily hydrolase